MAAPWWPSTRSTGELSAIPSICSTLRERILIFSPPALSPVEIEKQVTFPVETALAGTPGLLYTRSLSRNGFSQVTAVFTDRTNIYFARQQVNERLTALRQSLPPGVEPKMGPISTGLGEIYMWSVSYDAARSADDPYRTPEGEALKTEVERAAYLRTVQDWIVKPQIRGVPGVAGVDSIGGYVKQFQIQPDPMMLVGLGLSFGDITRAIGEDAGARPGIRRARRGPTPLGL